MDLLAFRSDLVRAIRSYFESQGVLEVTTPILRAAGAVEAHLDSVRTADHNFFMQTSPEYAMKILLSRHQASIYQICPAVRAGEVGSRHQIEFQMLEWYRLGFDLNDLISDLHGLLQHVSGHLEAYGLAIDFAELDQVSYKQLFVERFGVNPHAADLDQLHSLAEQTNLLHLDDQSSRSAVLEALFATGVEPGLQAPTVVRDYPACQSALAEIEVDAGDEVSRRFELFAGGLELANAYQELDDQAELAGRFADFNSQRIKLGKPEMQPDEKLIAATGSIGRYAGVALGVDRLAMVLLGVNSIDGVRL